LIFHKCDRYDTSLNLIQFSILAVTHSIQDSSAEQRASYKHVFKESSRHPQANWVFQSIMQTEMTQ